MSNMSPCEVASFVTGIACSIAKCCSQDEIELLAAVFVQLGDTLETISTQRELCEAKGENSNGFST